MPGAVQQQEQGPRERAATTGDHEALEVSVVIPCLDERETVAVCVHKGLQALEASGITGEVIVADNGSSDGSQELATAAGARVIRVEERGYGKALMGGIEAARGEFIVMADADDSYDLGETPRFVQKLREGYDLVQGCRLPRGGGRVVSNAMPVLHRYIGNPLFSALARRWFNAPVCDVYCGMRGFRTEHYESLDLRCAGMEFATEMIIKSSLQSAAITEVPITLHPDGRLSKGPHMRTVRDGWRTLRFFLMCSPRSLFAVPGVILILFGLLCFAVAEPGLTAFGVTFDAHTLLFGSLAILCGYNALLFSVFARAFAASEGLLPQSHRVERIQKQVTLERGLAAGVIALLVGGVLLILALNEWRVRDFGRLNYADTMRIVIPGVTLVAVGFQTVLASFLVSILTVRRV